MPKDNYIDTSSYFSIIENPDISNFLNDCCFLTEPSDDQLEEIKNSFVIEQFNNSILPENIIAIDSDVHETKVRKELPFTNVGYVKVASNLLKRTQYVEMSGNNFVDPFKVAKITKDKEELLLVLPCSNMSYKGQSTAKDSFRLALEEFFEKVTTKNKDEKLSLKETLFWLASYRENCGVDKIVLHKCPSCGHENIEVLNVKERQRCLNCNKYIYATDCLRIYEAVDEMSNSNLGALGRLKVVMKHIYLAHLIRTLKKANKETYINIFDNLAFVINGTLSIAGQPAWIHGSLMKIIYETNVEMRKNNKKDLVIIGIANEGSNVRTFAEMIESHVGRQAILCVDDEFRNKYIEFNRIPSSTTFGAETYYGQDFIYKSRKAKLFVFNLPYPFSTKENKEIFKREKSRKENYNTLSTALGIINEFECDMSDGTIVPVMLSEKYTAISIEPGATVLDLLTKNNIC